MATYPVGALAIESRWGRSSQTIGRTKIDQMLSERKLWVKENFGEVSAMEVGVKEAHEQKAFLFVQQF